MTNHSGIDFDPIYRRIPQLRDLDIRKARINKLPGYTNLNFRLRNGLQDWVLRIPKQITNQYINRQFEAHNVGIAETLEISPKCAWRDESGLSLTMTLNNTRPISLADFNKEPVYRQLVGIIRRLHGSKKNFHGRVDLSELLARYHRLTPACYRQLVGGIYRLAQGKIENLLTMDDSVKPSHNDLVLENILIDKSDRIWIIDWEYSSMASPYWDLATVCNAFKLDRQESQSLLASYRREVPSNGMKLLIDYRFVLQVLSICWMTAFTNTDMSLQVQNLLTDPRFEGHQARDIN